MNLNAPESELNEMITDIMKIKSVSFYGALQIALMFYVGMDIKPKSDEFYKECDNIKTLWER